MRPFGNDITNRTNSNQNNSNNNQNNNVNNNNNNNNVNNNTNNGDSDGNEDDPRIPAHIARIGGIITFSPIAGQGVIRVVGRCEDAKENSMLGSVIKFFNMAHQVVKIVERCENANEDLHLDLSECELMQIPDAVYHLMRNTELKTCNLSGNVIKKIAPKFAARFSLITDLNLSHNQLAKLPDELADLTALTRLNISHNSFIVLPPVVFKMQKLRELNASNNAIIEIDTDQMITSDSLEVVDLRNNPLGRTCHKKLNNAKTPFRIEVTEYNEDEDW